MRQIVHRRVRNQMIATSAILCQRTHVLDLRRHIRRAERIRIRHTRKLPGLRHHIRHRARMIKQPARLPLRRRQTRVATIRTKLRIRTKAVLRAILRQTPLVDVHLTLERALVAYIRHHVTLHRVAHLVHVLAGRRGQKRRVAKPVALHATPFDRLERVRSVLPVAKQSTTVQLGTLCRRRVPHALGVRPAQSTDLLLDHVRVTVTHLVVVHGRRNVTLVPVVARIAPTLTVNALAVIAIVTTARHAHLPVRTVLHRPALGAHAARSPRWNTRRQTLDRHHRT